MAEYEAYLIELAMALQMGIKHLTVMGDLNLVICQPSLVHNDDPEDGGKVFKF